MASLPHRALRARLARRLAVLTEAARRTVWQREDLRDNVAAAASIRAALAMAKIEPAGVSCLRAFADAEPRLARLGDTPELRRADAAFAAGHARLASPADTFEARAGRRAADFAGRPMPDRGASLLDWYAWSLAARSAITDRAVASPAAGTTGAGCPAP
jgi:hypothetical protein